MKHQLNPLLKLLIVAVLLAMTQQSEAQADVTQQPANANPGVTTTTFIADPVIAKGDGFTVKRSDLDQVMTGARANAAAEGKQLPPGSELQVLDQLIIIQVLLQKSTDTDWVEGQKVANQQYATLLQRVGSAEALTRQLKSVGMTEELLRQKATQEATAKATLRHLLGGFVTESEASQYYANHSSDFEEPPSVHVQHILLLTINTNTTPPSPLATNTVLIKREQIDDLLRRARAGEDFSALAKQYSEDLTTRDNGGDLPKFSKGRLVPEFESAAFALNTNQISDVVTTVYGYHIIKLLGKFPAKVGDFATVSNDIIDYLTRQKMSQQGPAMVERLKAAAHAEIVDPVLIKEASDRGESISQNEPQRAPNEPSFYERNQKDIDHAAIGVGTAAATVFVTELIRSAFNDQ